MITFSHPLMLLLIIPGALLVSAFVLIQQKLIAFLKEKVSQRFLHRLTAYSPMMLAIHTVMISLMFLFIVIASAGPLSRDVKKAKSLNPPLVIVIDSSFSMFAADILGSDGEDYIPRYQLVRDIAIQLVDALPDTPIGLMSFSGEMVIHAPPTLDHDALRIYIKNMQIHNFENTGTDFTKALDGLLFIHESHKKEGLQALILSDGERQMDGDFKDSLDAVKKRGIVIHTIACGTKSGGNVELYEPSDVYQFKETKEVALTFTSYREDKVLKRISKTSGGSFQIQSGPGNIEKLLLNIESGKRKVYVRDENERKDISWIFIFLFLLTFISEALFFDSKSALNLAEKTQAFSFSKTIFNRHKSGVKK